MKLMTYRLGAGAARLGIVQGDIVLDMAHLGERAHMTLPDNMLDFIDMGPLAVNAVQGWLDAHEPRHWLGCSVPLANVKVLAPIPRPRKNIFGIGLNYTEHIAESARALDTSNELPQQCVIFSKPPTAVIGPDDAIRHNKNVTKQLDWEGELAVIIGTRATRVSKERALEHVFGYSIINDVSARDCRRAGQWIVSKGQDTFAPMGPVIVTRDEITNPQTLDLYTRVNGVEKQRSNTRFMLFSVADIIADISAVITLEPGDIIASGTPAGVGAGRTPQEWMWPGDVVEVTVESIGTLRNYVINAAEWS